MKSFSLLIQADSADEVLIALQCATEEIQSQLLVPVIDDLPVDGGMILNSTRPFVRNAEFTRHE